MKPPVIKQGRQIRLAVPLEWILRWYDLISAFPRIDLLCVRFPRTLTGRSR